MKPHCGVWVSPPGADMKHFLNSFRSVKSFYYVGKRLGQYGQDWLRHGRSQQLVNGNALVARLLESALRVNVRFLRNAQACAIEALQDGLSQTVRFQTPQGQVTVRARKAVVLAAGGFAHDKARQAQLFKHVKNGTPHHSAAPLSNTGDSLRLGEIRGGSVDDTQAAAGAWAPVSLVPQADGSWGRFPHLVERGKPGLIAVNAQGKRFTNESGPYHTFIQDMLAAIEPHQRAVAWLVCDHVFIRRYGLGAVKPFPLSLKPWLQNGYLKRANSLSEFGAPMWHRVHAI